MVGKCQRESSVNSMSGHFREQLHAWMILRNLYKCLQVSLFYTLEQMISKSSQEIENSIIYPGMST